MVKRGYFRGASFPVKNAATTTIVASAHLPNGYWAACVSLCVDKLEVNQKVFGKFILLALALEAANEYGRELADNGHANWNEM